MLDLGLSEEQEQLRDAFRSLFDRESTPEVVREAEPLGFRPQLWSRVSELGIVDMALPVDAGGAGATLVDAAVVCEVAGAALAPVPVVETIVAARLLAALAAIGNQDAATLLESAVAGSTLITLGLRPADPHGVCRWVPTAALRACPKSSPTDLPDRAASCPLPPCMSSSPAKCCAPPSPCSRMDKNSFPQGFDPLDKDHRIFRGNDGVALSRE